MTNISEAGGLKGIKCVDSRQQSGFVSQGNVGVFLPRVGLLLAGKNLQVSADSFASGRRLDDVVHEA